MTAEQNLELIQRYLAEHSPLYVTDDAIFEDLASGLTLKGADSIGAYLYELYHVAFPGASAEPRHINASSDTVTAEFTFRGRNDGPFMEADPTGRDVEIPMAVVYDISNGKIAGIRLYYDAATFAQQLSPTAQTA